MPFIGQEPVTGAFRLLDAIDLTGITGQVSFDLELDSAPFVASSARNLIVSLNGVTQAPETAFTVSGSIITFASALTSSDVIDYILVLGDVGTLPALAQNSVGESELNYPLTNFSSTGIDDNATSTQITLTNAATSVDNILKPASIKFNGSTGITWEEIIDDVLYTRYGLSYGGNRLSFTYDGSTIARFLSSGEFEVYNDLTVDTDTLVVNSTTGNVGIGDDDPVARLQVSAGGQANSPTLGSIDANAPLYVTNNDHAYGLVTGVNAANGRVWMQAQRTDGTATAYSITFNEAGGNVGIGATDPAQELEVAGTILASPVAYSSNQDEAYLIAGTAGWTGATTNWNTFGFQHRIKTDSNGVPRITIDNHAEEVFSLTNSRKVGIGTGAPSAKLHVKGDNLGSTQYDKSQLGWFHHNNGNVSYLEVFGFRTSAGSDWTTSATRIEQRIDSTSQSYIQFNGTGNTYGISFGAGSGISNANSEDIVERMRITAVGEVLFNRTSTPNISNSFDFGWRRDLGSLYLNCASATGPLLLNQTTGDTATRNEIRFFRNEVQVGSVTANTTTTFYNTTSDYRVKENVVPLENALERIKQIPVRRFNFIADPDTTVDGFIAHEVSEVVPEAIFGEKDGMATEEYEVTPEVIDESGEVVEAAVMGTREVPEYQGIDQSKLVPLLTKAIQEQQTIIEDLQTRLSALEAN